MRLKPLQIFAKQFYCWKFWKCCCHISLAYRQKFTSKLMYYTFADAWEGCNIISSISNFVDVPLKVIFKIIEMMKINYCVLNYRHQHVIARWCVFPWLCRISRNAVNRRFFIELPRRMIYLWQKHDVNLKVKNVGKF